MFWTYVCTFSLMFVGVLLMFIVLLQRGRGGGLAGAFGGLGGQSAFGTKAGDVFTKITVVLATVWVVLAGVSGYAMRSDATSGFEGGKKGKSSVNQENDDKKSSAPDTTKTEEKAKTPLRPEKTTSEKDQVENNKKPTEKNTKTDTGTAKNTKKEKDKAEPKKTSVKKTKDKPKTDPPKKKKD